MSVLIKGMKMPSECRECPFVEYYWQSGETLCSANSKILAYDFKPIAFDGRHPDCPLVEIPAHGRLIDADALIEVCEAWRHEAQKRDASINLRFANAVIAQVKLQPTVIEAEEE